MTEDDLEGWLHADAALADEDDYRAEPRELNFPTHSKDPERSLFFRERFERGRRNAETHMSLLAAGAGLVACPCMTCRFRRGAPVE